MNPFSRFTGDKLEWARPKLLKRQYELRDGSEVYATLTWSRSLSSMATAQVDGAEYKLERRGLLHSRITMHRAPLGEDVASMSMSMRGGGEMSFADGTTYLLERPSMWRNKWTISAASGGTVLSFSVKALSWSGEALIDPLGKRDRHLPLLIVLGWYAVILTLETEAASSTGAG